MERKRAGEVLANWRAHSEKWSEHQRCEHASGTHLLKSEKKGKVRTQKESDRARGTHILEGIEGEVRTQRESEQVRNTHALESADGRTIIQATQRKETREGYSRTREREWWTSGHKWEASEGHSPTGDRRGRSQEAGRKRERGYARPVKHRGWDKSRNRRKVSTHRLESTEGGTSQDTGIKRANEQHSLSGEWRRDDLCGQPEKASERSALTLWRALGKGKVRTRKKEWES